MIDPVQLPILMKAVDFIFDEVRKILEKRRERRKQNDNASYVRTIRQFCKLETEGQSLMRAACACHQILKLVLTIADLGESDEIQSSYLADAFQDRPKIIIG